MQESLLQSLSDELNPDLAENQPDEFADDPIAWMEHNFYLYDTGELLTLASCQKQYLLEALSLRPDGSFRYNTVVWSWPKKSAKSTIIAALVHYVAYNFPRRSIKLVANDLNQANSRVGYYLRESIKLHPKHKDEVQIKREHLIIYPNGSRVEMVPVDPDGEAGGNDDLIVYSELHGWKSRAHLRMWAEMTLSPNKFAHSQRWIDTYAGHVGESPILENLYEAGVKGGREVWPDSEVYANDAARLLCVWVTRHLLPWQTDANGRNYYAQEATTLTDAEYRRLHGNQWVSSVDKFVPDAWWDACYLPIAELNRQYPFNPKEDELVCTLDAAVTNDCFGILAASRHDKFVIPRFIFKWIPPVGGFIQYSNLDDPTDERYPEGVVRMLADRFNVIVFGYDPTQLHHFCTQLSDGDVGYFKTFNQGQPRLIADKQLYDVIRDRKLLHDGNADLTEHIYNSNKESDDQGSKLRIVKRSPSMKIDLAVCLSMAVDLAYKFLPE